MTDTFRCRHCFSEVPDGASRCAHCGSRLSRTLVWWRAVFIVAVVLLGVMLWSMWRASQYHDCVGPGLRTTSCS